MDSVPTAEAACTRLPIMIEQDLRASQPSTKISTTQHLADTSVNTILYTATQISTHIEARRERTGFYTLPRELRDMVYGFAASGDVFGGNFHDAEGLLMASKQVREEFIPIYYARRIVVYISPQYEYRETTPFIRWLENLGRSRSGLMTGVELRFQESEVEMLWGSTVILHLRGLGDVISTRDLAERARVKYTVVVLMGLHRFGVPWQRFQVMLRSSEEDGSWQEFP